MGSTSGETEGNYQFSSTLGAGVKIYPSPRVGVKLGVRWVPTYIKSDSTGWWCDPYWGCYVTSDPQFSNQFQFAGRHQRSASRASGPRWRWARAAEARDLEPRAYSPAPVGTQFLVAAYA